MTHFRNVILLIFILNCNCSSDDRFVDKLLFPKHNTAHIRRHHVPREATKSDESIDDFVTQKDLHILDAELMICQPSNNCQQIKSFYLLQKDTAEFDCFQHNIIITFEMKVLNKDNQTYRTRVATGYLTQDGGAESDVITLDKGKYDNCQKIKRFNGKKYL